MLRFRRGDPVPPQALLLSLLCLWVPILASAVFPDWTTEDVGLLIWILALVPGFLLSYYRGWRGASLAIAGGMAALATTHVLFLIIGGEPPQILILLGIVAVIVVVALGSGWLSHIFHEALARERRLALTDLGTGLPNRRHGILELEKSFAAAVRGHDLSLVLFDLDDFKRINDTFGHATGDRVLAEFGGILQNMTRAMNVSARYGGEEFISVLRDTPREGAKIFADRVRVAFKELELPTGTVTVSAGVAEYEEGMASPDVLIAAADQALYAAKRAGRDRVVVMESGEAVVVDRSDEKGAAGVGAAGAEDGWPGTSKGSPRGEPGAGGEWVRSESGAEGGGRAGDAGAGARGAARKLEEAVGPAGTGQGEGQGQGTGEAADGGRTRDVTALSDLGAGDGRGQGELILLVDDDVDALRGLARILRRFGYSVLESPSPQQALNVIRGLEDPVDLLMTDIVMPEMSGFRLVEMVTEIQGDVRVLYMSGYSQGEVDWSGVPGMAHDYMSKPISTSTLIRRVRKLLDAPVQGTTGSVPSAEGEPRPGRDREAPRAGNGQGEGKGRRRASEEHPKPETEAGQPEVAPVVGSPGAPGSTEGRETPSAAGRSGVEGEPALPARAEPPEIVPGTLEDAEASSREQIRAETQVLVLLGDPGLRDALVHRIRKDDVAEVRAAESPWSVIDRLPHLRADVLVVDQDLPREEIDDLFRAIRSRRWMGGAPAILVLAASDDWSVAEMSTLREALPLVDFLQKPFELSALEARIQNLLQMKSWEKWSNSLEQEMNARIAAKTAELEEAREDILRRLAWLGECRDDLTGQHAERVGILAREIARRLGWSRPRSNILEKAATLHDIGKVAVPDSVLNKPGSLTPSERKIMERHVIVGAQLLSGSRNPLLRVAEEIAAHHHEHWNGEGYPEGLKGEDIPLSARIVSVADAFDSMMHNRSYRGGRTREETIRVIVDESGSQFDPQVVDAFMELVETGALDEILNMDLVAQPEAVKLGLEGDLLRWGEED